MYIQKAVENLLADRDIKRAAHAELRATCEQVLEEIRCVAAVIHSHLLISEAGVNKNVSTYSDTRLDSYPASWLRSFPFTLERNECL